MKKNNPLRPSVALAKGWRSGVSEGGSSVISHPSSFAYFGGGCFWCTEAMFNRLKGVISVTPGYAGGDTIDPTYEQVSSGYTGHAEVIQIEFDPETISYETLLEVFFATHNPTSLNFQDSDRGTQYRSIILTTSKDQQELAEAKIRQLTAQKIFNLPIVTDVTPLLKFYPAEEYHRNYYENNKTQPYCQIVISPKTQKLRDKFKHLIDDSR